MPEPIRVILADDHALVRQGIRLFLEEADDIVVVAEAADGDQAVKLVEEHRPDVAVLDIQMPGLSGIEATRLIKARFPEVRVLILTAYDEDPYVLALLQAGASGYLLKSADADALLRAVRSVHKGESVLSSQAAAKVFRQIGIASGAQAIAAVETPTAREIEVLRLVAQGLTNLAIGHQLGISARTVQGHLANLYGKLGVQSRTEAVTAALKLGWIDLK
jgi:DNA-binding NarL/FixJ family response regulator